MKETIAAVSTAISTSGISIVRISGPEALDIADRIYRSPSKNKKLKEVPTHTIHYGFIHDGEEEIDQVLVMVMRAPHTFTGEDTVEINCHGGILVTGRVLRTVLSHGAVPAGPGEFSKRAFLNGHMDLTQAEAVMDLIESKNDLSRHNSLSRIKGLLQKKLGSLRSGILYEVAFIESALDDPEHISLEGYPVQLKEKLYTFLKEMDDLLKTCEQGKLIQEGVRTVILGKPNAGKSSLLNRMLGEERAIVTDIAGTTRDTLEEYMNLGGITLHLTDTAGIRQTTDKVEKIGVDRAMERAEQADLILFVADSTSGLDDDDRQILKLLEGKKAIILYNKTDLPPVMDIRELEESSGHRVLPVSVKENTGLKELEAEIRSLFFSGSLNQEEDVWITSERHRHLLLEAKDAVGQVLISIEQGLPEDFYTIDLMAAYESLGKITGEEAGEDLINEIFSRFCVGK